MKDFSGSSLEQLMGIFSKFPGLGPRSSRRIILHLLKQREKVFEPFLHTLHHVLDNVKTCEVCFNLDMTSPCHICTHTGRSSGSLCVVENVDDLWAMERTGIFKGKYHVLGGVLAALEGVRPEDLNIASLVRRVQVEPVEEIILALNATINGQTTAHYLMDCLAFAQHLTITSLARGVPMGGELDYLDEGTLTTAFLARRSVAA